MRYLGPKEKIERRIGEKLFIKGDRCAGPKCQAVRRNYKAGVHGHKRSRPASEYGRQLLEKQKARFMYGLSERQMKRYFNQALQRKKNMGDYLFRLLEMQIANVVLKSGFAQSVNQARQRVNHGFVLLNGKKVTIPTRLVKINDVISLSKRTQNTVWLKDMQGSIVRFNPPSWLVLDKEKLEIKIVSEPKSSQDSPVGLHLLVELYSR